MPYIGRAPTSTATKLEDADQDTKIQVEESSDEDTIRFDIAGAEDFTMTANALNVLSGSTLNINSGATIANAGTDTGFGADAERAMAGVLQANANFVDQVIFGPSVDGQSWNGLWSKASVFSSLMLATIEDEGSNTEINIWDLTEQTSGTISTTPLATVDLANAATPTSIAASMGYLIVGSEDGFAIIDPHSGAWAERTVGWPRTLSSSTVPALTNNDVNAVAAGVYDDWPLDPRTGGKIPCFIVGYGTGADIGSIIKYDGNVWDRSGTVNNTGVAIIAGRSIMADNAEDMGYLSDAPISAITADDFDISGILRTGAPSYALGMDNAVSTGGDLVAGAAAAGLSFQMLTPLYGGGADSDTSPTAAINRTYNTGYMVGDIRGAWLANSKTVDRSYKANTLTETGTVTEGVVETSAELLGYSAFSDSTNFLRRAYDADLQFSTGAYSIAFWVKCAGNSGQEFLFFRGRPSIGTNPQLTVKFQTAGYLEFNNQTGGANDTPVSPRVLDDGVWHQVVCVRDTTSMRLYVDGNLEASATNNSLDMNDTSATLTIGADSDGANAADNCTLSLMRVSATVPTATQIRQMYDAEKGMFVASAECLLQSGSTDAVLDVDVDPLSNKVIVTQTDAITIFDGLVVDSKPTVNSGASEKGKLWGDLRTEQNAANAYVTAPAVDQRQVNEMVRGLASELPKGVDLSKAKAWIQFNGESTIAINTSYNIKSITDVSTGQYDIRFAVPFKSDKYVCVATCDADAYAFAKINGAVQTAERSRIIIIDADKNIIDSDDTWGVWFGELENEY